MSIYSTLCSGPHHQKRPWSRWMWLLLIYCIDIVDRVYVVRWRSGPCSHASAKNLLGFFSHIPHTWNRGALFWYFRRIWTQCSRARYPGSSRNSLNHFLCKRGLWWPPSTMIASIAVSGSNALTGSETRWESFLHIYSLGQILAVPAALWFFSLCTASFTSTKVDEVVPTVATDRSAEGRGWTGPTDGQFRGSLTSSAPRQSV